MDSLLLNTSVFCVSGIIIWYCSNKLSDIVDYVDDSKGTNVGATVAAIEGLGQHEHAHLILIAGGDGNREFFVWACP